MGYYSDFNISVIAGIDPTDSQEFCDYFHSIVGCDCDDLYGIKWYDMSTDMITISTQYPRTIFAVEWNGEESDDMGTYYFHAGKCSGGPAHVVHPPFNHSDFTFATDYPELLV